MKRKATPAAGDRFGVSGRDGIGEICDVAIRAPSISGRKEFGVELNYEHGIHAHELCVPTVVRITCSNVERAERGPFLCALPSER